MTESGWHTGQTAARVETRRSPRQTNIEAGDQTGVSRLINAKTPIHCSHQQRQAETCEKLASAIYALIADDPLGKRGYAYDTISTLQMQSNDDEYGMIQAGRKYK